MPNIKSAKKRVLVTEKKTLQNKMFKSALKTEMKKYEAAVVAGDKELAQTTYKSAVKKIDQAVAAGILLVMLLMYFIMSYYVNPLYKMSAGVDNYRTMSKRHVYTFEGEDQLANINTGLTELIDENLELKKRVKTLREEREKFMSANQTSQEV